MYDRRKIKDIKTNLFHVPLRESLSDAKHGTHTFFELITVTVCLEDGSEGTGYTYTGGVGGRAIYDMVEYDLKPILIGKDGDKVEALWDEMNWKVHYVARGGIASFAISAVDIALWDIRCKNANLPLWKMVGGVNDSTKAYYGGIDLAFSQEKLLDNIKNQLAKGHTAVKIKLGKETLQEDIERVAAVRELLGPEKVFMVDANYSWSVEKAIKAVKALEPYDILWLEEPTIPCDFKGYARIADHSNIGIAMGENLHTIYEHRHAMEIGKVSFIQPDASNIGGITGWIKVAHMAEGFNIPVCTHGMQELHVSLLSGIPNAGYLEVHSFPIDEYTMRPLVLKNGRAISPDVSGTGVEFDWKKLSQYKIEM
ncbi:mandelate racemase/muconate lactonizing enzyme family protein [Clostridium grantii]|uniref:L-alanine-DL-glutamate epimerase n=1 Tax=Clostridium grantii DSM 8605 TaxID=1121316 RepID=A0A1M5WA11_9CLOT|nr:mandelate racemase/muconate lactonizing enzyme family protein [Clostridium grantii]SHH84332.1 L-alanine-DL-glutamate epimerase [Clostridium grantii DSM 8605]